MRASCWRKTCAWQRLPGCSTPVLGTEQNRQGLGPNVEEIAALCERTLHKTHFGACFDGLQDILPPGRKQIVVTGCEAHVCMLQTAIGLLELGYEVIIAIDAVGSRQGPAATRRWPAWASWAPIW